MPIFKKLPVIIEARQFTQDDAIEVYEWLKDSDCKISRKKLTDNIFIEIVTLEGKIVASEDDWIIKGVKGEFYPCKPDIFDLTYSLYDSDSLPDKAFESVDKLSKREYLTMMIIQGMISSDIHGKFDHDELGSQGTTLTNRAIRLADTALKAMSDCDV